MTAAPLIFRVHAIKRMFERHITERDVRHVLETGVAIARYPENVPYPSRLILGWCGPRPVHVVAADNIAANETIVITVYEPDPAEWQHGFERRKR